MAFILGNISIVIGIGILLSIGIGLYIYKNKRQTANKLLDDRINELFYALHASYFLQSTQQDVFIDTATLEEVLFFHKEKLFSEPIGYDRLQTYLEQGTNDLQYIHGLLSSQQKE